MNLKDLLNQGRLRQHKTSKNEIENLLALARRDIKDSKVENLLLKKTVKYFKYNFPFKFNYDKFMVKKILFK